MTPRWHRTCHHKTVFRLTCDQYIKQVELTENCCELCGIRADWRPEKMLHIDHDGGVGQWAVRGLLCAYCNAMLGLRKQCDIPGVPNETVRDYLTHPWYKRILAEAGAGESLPAPAPGTLVLVGGKPLRRFGRSWDRIVHAWGPHNIQLMSPDQFNGRIPPTAIW